MTLYPTQRTCFSLCWKKNQKVIGNSAIFYKRFSHDSYVREQYGYVSCTGFWGYDVSEEDD